MILVATGLLFLVTLFSGWLPLFTYKKKIKLNILISFCSGAMIAMSFVHMLPMTFEQLGPDSGYYILIGFLFVYLLEKFSMVHPCQEGDCNTHHLGLSAFAGLSVHGIVSGLSVGVALVSAQSPSDSFPIIFAFVLHKIPEAFILATLLMQTRSSPKNRYLLVLLFSMIAPLGILISDYSLHHLVSTGLNLLLGVSTGTFIYIASSDLLPNIHAEDKNRWLHLFAFAAGVVVLALL